MADDQAQPDNVAPDEETNAQSANDNAASMEQALEKLYTRLPKVIARITESNGKEAEAALSSLFASFRKINEIEAKLVQPGDDYKPMNLSRIYELAVSGNAGGDEAAMAELQEANAQFAEQNTILSELVESMTYQIDSMKRQAADEMLGMGKAKTVPLKDLEKVLTDVRETLGKVESQMAILGQPDNLQTLQKPLDERLVEGLMGLDDISAEMLKISPKNPGFIGRALRRAGFAYDHKDLVTARMLVLTVIKANKKMAEVIATLAPVKAQIENLHHMLTLVELYAGHEERQGTQYQESLAEIARLQTRIERYEAQQESMESHEALQESVAALEITVQKNKDEIAKQEDYLAALALSKYQCESKLDKKQKKRNSQKNSTSSTAQSNDIEEHTDELAQQSNDIEILEKNTALEAEIKELNAQISAMQDEHNQKNQRQNQELISLQNRLRMTEDGLLVQKLESEIAGLTIVAEGYEKQVEEEVQTRLAFEERIEIWVKDEDTLQAEVDSLRKKLALKASYIAAAVCGAAAAGYGTAAVFKLGNTPLCAYFAAVTLIPSVFAGVKTAITAANSGFVDSKEVIVSGLRGAVMGALIGAIGIVPIVYHQEKVEAQHAEQDVGQYAAELRAAQEQVIQISERSKAELQAAKNDANRQAAQVNLMINNCEASPCMIVQDKGGQYSIAVLSRKYNGEVLTFDFSKKGGATMSHKAPEKVQQPSVKAP